MKKLLSRGFVLSLLVFASFRSVADTHTSVTSGNWFIRGTGTNLAYYSMVIPLDGQTGTVGAPSLATTLAAPAFSLTNLWHYDATNTLSQTNVANRFLITNAVAAFGSKYGGTPLYFNQAYHFGAYAGDWAPAGGANTLIISVVDRTTGNYVGVYYIAAETPITNNSTLWTTFMQNGATLTNEVPGLKTTLTIPALTAWGQSGLGTMEFTHVADSTASNYEYTVWGAGAAVTNNNWLVDSRNAVAFYSPLYTMDFDPQSPLQPLFVSQPHFQGQPMPSAYVGKSLTELLAVHAVVNNTVTNTATNWTDLDNSPELRDSPILDQFVTDMGSNALALTSYVFNQIELTDALAYNSNTNTLSDISVNLGGINRSALGTYLEGQGSPAEQCALLIYLLRRSGVPAAYIYGPVDGVQMLDTRLSTVLRMQLKGIVNQSTGQIYTTNTLISVNYPWVAAYIGGQWVHLFPWLKDTEVDEGLNLYDYLPANYNNGYKWVRQYIMGDTNIFSLNTNDDTVNTLFPLFVQHSLLTNAPGVSLDDIGTKAFNRQVQFTRWSDFPTPFAVTNGAVNSVHDLTSITNIFPSWTNIFDTVSVLIASSANTNKFVYTGDLRMADLHDRKFLIRHQATNSGNYNLILSLAPYRPTATNQHSFTNDATLTNQQILSMTLTTSDDPINVTIVNKRHRTEPGGVTNVNYFASYGGLNEFLTASHTYSIHLGDLAAICLHCGRVTDQMLRPWAQEYWTMQQEVAANPSITNTLSPDITLGTLPYLMGMSYYKRYTEFGQQLAQLHKVQVGQEIGEGLSTVSAQRDTNGVLISPLSLYHPHVDMLELQLSAFGNATLRPDESGDLNLSQTSYGVLDITAGSAQEHKITEDFYSQVGGISSVRLLLQSQQTNQGGFAELNVDNYNSFSNTLAPLDSFIWSNVVAAFKSPSNSFPTVFITQKIITNTVVGYKGMGALI